MSEVLDKVIEKLPRDFGEVVEMVEYSNEMDHIKELYKKACAAGDHEAMDKLHILAECTRAIMGGYTSGKQGINPVMLNSIILPLKNTEYRISSPFGHRNAPTAGASTDHKGIDYAVKEGTAVYAATSGKIIESSYNTSRGNYIKIDNGAGLITVYQHLKDRVGNKGDFLQQGALIGYAGKTGTATGSHLHFETWLNGTAVDPEGLLNGSMQLDNSSVGKKVIDFIKADNNWLYAALIIGNIIRVVVK